MGAAWVNGGVVHPLCVGFGMAGVLKAHWVGGGKTEEKAVHDRTPFPMWVDCHGEEDDFLGDKFSSDDCFAFSTHS